MSTWEERMAARAAGREQDRQAVAAAAEAAEAARYNAEHQGANWPASDFFWKDILVGDLAQVDTRA